MGKLKCDITVSLDGFVAGPNPRRDEPLGVGGEKLHEWILRLASWRATHGREGGETGPDDDVVAESQANVGAAIMGRGMFGPDREGGPWGDYPWEGWWEDDPPFSMPVFVLTHHEREPLVKGDTTFHFVTDGLEAAHERAREAAGDRDISVGGGASTIRQYVDAGLADELQLHVVPILLGDGVRLFEGLEARERTLEIDRVVDSPRVTHIRYRLAR